MKQDALAIVPLNIGKLEGICLDHNRKLTADDKKRLLEILRSKMEENRSLLHAKRQAVMEQVLSAERERVNLDAYRREMDMIDEEIATLHKRRDANTLRCQNQTGFDIDGTLIAQDPQGYGSGGSEARKIWAHRRQAGLRRANAIREKMDLAAQLVDRFGLKFDKVETRLVLASSYGEAMNIMEAVLGNGDTILDAEPVEEAKE